MGLLLKTFGMPALISRQVREVHALRRKDLALLIYMRLSSGYPHSRSVLAELLWGDYTEAHARHSLTQAIGRLRAQLGARSVTVEGHGVRWNGDLPCDAAILQDACADDQQLDSQLHLYSGDFLEDFDLGAGAESYEVWASEKRVHFRMLALSWVQKRGEEAEQQSDWQTALQLGRRAVEIEPILEAGHRRIMRSWAALGERALALKHFDDFFHWLESEVGVAPDPVTRALAMHIRESN